MASANKAAKIIRDPRGNLLSISMRTQLSAYAKDADTETHVASPCHGVHKILSINL